MTDFSTVPTFTRAHVNTLPVPTLHRSQAARANAASFVHLDLVRGAAALLVLSGHLRAFVFVDFPSAESPNLLVKAFYFFTGFGHQAVMIFFVLSGFLISKGVVERAGENRWSWLEYGVSRLSRLWMVLIPCLLLTLFWDSLGMRMGSPAFYEGRLANVYNSGPLLGALDLSVLSMLGNIFFLQTIAVTTYGSNGPLWSLANEFWYYVMFPLAYLSLVSLYRPALRLVHGGLFIILALLLPAGLVFAGIIWLFGYLVRLAYDSGRFRAIARRVPYGILACLAFFTAMTAARLNLFNAMNLDLLVGATFAALLLSLLGPSVPSRAYAKVAGALSNMSYTVYLVHFSFLAFWASFALQNRQMQVAPLGIAIFCILFVSSLIYAYLVYRLFERNTLPIRNYILARATSIER